MECLYHEAIAETAANVRTLSYDEKKSPLCDEKLINSFLDQIIEFKLMLNDKTSRINAINESFEKLTWFTDLDQDCLMKVNDIISSAKDLRSSLVRQYVSMDFLRIKGIAKDEIRDFKSSIDDLREAYEDLESVFFYLPEMPDFKETTRLLSLV